MKKVLIITLISLLTILGLAACGGNTSEEETSDEGTYIEDDASELTLYANGGEIMMGVDPPTGTDLGVYTIEPGVTFGEGINEYIDDMVKDGAEFVGWKIYAVTDGEWVTEEITDLADSQECVPCGDYGYYLMNEYEVLYEAATTEEMQSCIADGRDYYAMAVWK